MKSELVGAIEAPVRRLAPACGVDAPSAALLLRPAGTDKRQSVCRASVNVPATPFGPAPLLPGKAAPLVSDVVVTSLGPWRVSHPREVGDGRAFRVELQGPAGVAPRVLFRKDRRNTSAGRAIALDVVAQPRRPGVWEVILPMPRLARGAYALTVVRDGKHLDGVRITATATAYPPLRAFNTTVKDGVGRQSMATSTRSLAIERQRIALAIAQQHPPEWERPFLRPVPRDIVEGNVFGLMRRIDGGQPKAHSGLDYAPLPAEASTRQRVPVRATNDGRVALVMDGFYFQGNGVIIDHGGGVATQYFHLQEVPAVNAATRRGTRRVLLRQGDLVRRGQELGLMGDTGRACNVHLHYAASVHGIYVDPRSLETLLHSPKAAVASGD